MTTLILSENDKLILKAMVDLAEPSNASAIAEITNIPPMHVGNRLKYMTKGNLVELVDKKHKLWVITDAGKSAVAELMSLPLTQRPPETVQLPAPPDTGERHPQATPMSDTHERHPQATPIQTVVVTREPAAIKEVVEEQPQETIVPSQAAILREIGERLGVSTTPKKGEGATLDAIIYWVERTADMNNLTEVWNRLTETGVPLHIIKRWVTLYAQTIPGKEIPEELKEKLAMIAEKDRVTATEKGEVPPKPKRFSVVAGQIVGDPEGDYDFNQAYKIWATEKGVPSNQADPLGIALNAMVQASKDGPQTAIATLTAMTPFLTKETLKHDDTAMLQFITAQQTTSQNQMQMMQQMIIAALEGKHNAEIEGVKALVTQKPPESSEQMRLLTEQINNQNQQINSLRESLHQEQIITIKEQNKAMIDQMQNQMTRLEQQIAAAAQGKSVDSKIGLLDKTLDKGAQELSGVRQDIKGFASMMMAKGEPLPKPRSQQEKQRFATSLEKNIEKAQEARRQAQELWGTPQA